jgi:ParB/RepB/Spo0J family partition protein
VGKSREQIAAVNGSAPAALNYELIAGERRWRAAKQESLALAPVIVRALSDQEAMELHLIEQLQHDDWTPIEEADGYRMLLDLRTTEGKPVYTGETLAAKIGKTRQYIYQRLKLLHLPKIAREALEQGEISAEVARLDRSDPEPGTAGEGGAGDSKAAVTDRGDESATNAESYRAELCEEPGESAVPARGRDAGAVDRGRRWRAGGGTGLRELPDEDFAAGWGSVHESAVLLGEVR